MATVDVDQVVAPDPREALTVRRLVLLASLAALGALATNIMLPAFPAMARDLGVAPDELAWILSSFFIVFAVGQLFVGPLADAFGRAPFVVGGLAVFVTGSVVCALAPTLPVLIAGRAIQALGACAASVLARAIARDLYHGPKLTRALALVMIAMAAAPGFSPALGTGIAAAFGCVAPLCSLWWRAFWSPCIIGSAPERPCRSSSAARHGRTRSPAPLWSWPSIPASSSPRLPSVW
jgi:MFS transporter, DHA1 family, multidrug resistance protein